MRGLLIATTFMVAAAYAAPAHALVFDLTQGVCPGAGCGTGSNGFGTIDVEQGTPTNNTATNSVTVTETLANGVQFYNTASERALLFNLQGNPALNAKNLTITGLPTALTAAAGVVKTVSFGSFEYSITCKTCSSTTTNPFGNSFSFTITNNAAGSTLTPLSFVSNATHSLFAIEISVSAGPHGYVAAVPEPASMALLVAGLISVGVVRRRTS